MPCYHKKLITFYSNDHLAMRGVPLNVTGVRGGLPNKQLWMFIKEGRKVSNSYNQFPSDTVFDMT